MTELLSPIEIERRITAIDRELESFTDDYGRTADAAAEAEADYRLRYYQTIMRLKDSGQKMTDKEAEARATAAAANEFRAYKLTAARLDAAKQGLQTLRSRLDALRTLAASARIAAGQP